MEYFEVWPGGCFGADGALGALAAAGGFAWTSVGFFKTTAGLAAWYSTENKNIGETVSTSRQGRKKYERTTITFKRSFK